MDETYINFSAPNDESIRIVQKCGIEFLELYVVTANNKIEKETLKLLHMQI